jgi:hypothetical protein
METETAKITTFSTEPENSSKPTPTKKSSVLSKIKKLFVSPQKPQNYCKEQTKFVLKAKKVSYLSQVANKIDQSI